jgi:hypothetical protein
MADRRTAQGQLPKLPDKTEEPKQEAGPPRLSSNNWNSFVTSPYSPLTATAGGTNINPQIDSIRAFSVQQIQVLADFNIASPYSFSINGNQITPNRIYSGIANATITGGTTNSFVITYITGNPVFAVENTRAIFQNSSFPYILTVVGTTKTSLLSVGAPLSDVPSGSVALINGNVVVNGTITSTGSFDISGLQVSTLGVKQLLDVSGQTVLYGPVTARSGINVIGDSYILGNLGINTINPATALDVSGNIRVSNNLDVSGNVQITGNTEIDGTLDVSGTVTLKNVDILNAYVENILSVTGGIDLSGSGALNINYSGIPPTTPSGSTVMQINGFSNFYNDVEIDAQLFVDAPGSLASAFSRIKPTLLINENNAEDINARLEVAGLSNFIGSVAIKNNIDVSGNARIYGTLDSRIPTSSPTVSSATPTLPLNSYATMYIIDNSAFGNTITVDTTTTPYYPNMVGTTSYFAATTAAGGVLLKYYGLGGTIYTMTVPVPAPGLITMNCVGSNGSSRNYFSTYPYA